MAKVSGFTELGLGFSQAICRSLGKALFSNEREDMETYTDERTSSTEELPTTQVVLDSGLSSAGDGIASLEEQTIGELLLFGARLRYKISLNLSWANRALDS